jgi:hypothetical protein
MTFCGGNTEEGGFETAGRGRGVDIWFRISLLPLRDFLRDFMVKYRGYGENDRLKGR